MIRKSAIVVVTMFCLLLVGFTSTALAMEKEDNPIDKAFVTDWAEAGSTVEMNYVAGKYMEAWQGEMNHAAIITKEKYKFAEDKAHIDDYIAAYEKVADAAVYMEWLNWSDIDSSPVGRRFGTGATSASLSAKAAIYKQATLHLIQAYQGNLGDSPDNNFKYSYLYEGNGAELAKVKENRGQKTIDAKE